MSDFILGTPNVDIVCKCDNRSTSIIQLPKVKSAYAVLLRNTDNNIIIIDEDTEDFGSDDFVRLLQESNNYFILITRKKMSNIPVSVNEIYEISSNTKYNSLKKQYVYNTLKNMYADDSQIEINGSKLKQVASEFRSQNRIIHRGYRGVRPH